MLHAKKENMHRACLSKHNSNGEKQTILLMIQTEKDGITLQQQDYWY